MMGLLYPTAYGNLLYLAQDCQAKVSPHNYIALHILTLLE